MFVRAVTAVFLVLAISATAGGQVFEKLLGVAPKERPEADAGAGLVQAIEDVQSRIRKFNDENAGRRDELNADLAKAEARSKEIRAAMETEGVAPEEVDVLKLERDAFDDRIATIRDLLEVIDAQLEALRALEEALRLKASVTREVAEFAESGTRDIASATLPEVEAAERTALAARRAADLSNLKLLGFEEERTAAHASVASRKEALKRLREEAQAGDEEAKEKADGLDAEGLERLNRKSRVRSSRVKNADLAVRVAERRVEAADTRVQAAKAFLEAGRAKAEMLERRADAIAAKLVLTGEQLEAERQALATAEAAVAEQSRRQDRAVARQRAALQGASEASRSLRAERDGTAEAEAAARLDKRIANALLREEIARSAMTLASERLSVLKLKADLARARVKRVETPLAARSEEFGRNRLSSIHGDLKDLVGQWSKRRQLIRSTAEQTMQAARDAFTELTTAKEQLALLEAKRKVTESEGPDPAILKERVDLLAERRRVLVELAELQAERAELTGQVLVQYRRAEDFVLGLIGGTRWVGKRLAQAGEALAAAWKRVLPFFQSILIFAAGFVVSGWLARQASRIFRVRGDVQAASFARKAVLYPLVFFTITMGLGILDIQLSAILAAAGILTVAVGFAAQNSVGNIISGVFLMIDRPFKIGEAVDVGGTAGVVLSIDLLSTKLRTFDNLFVRIPNETIVKSNITNFVAHPVRRYDINVGIAYGDDLSRALQVLAQVARNHKDVLENPQPEVRVENFGDNAVELVLRYWAAWTKGYALLHDLRVKIKTAFDEQGITIPFPQRTLWPAQRRPVPPNPADGGDATPSGQ